METFYRYSLNERRLIYGFFAMYILCAIFSIIGCFVSDRPLSSVFYILMGGVNLLFPFYILRIQNKVLVDSKNRKLIVSDRSFFVKPVIVDIDRISQIDIIKSENSGKVHRLLVRLGDNIFYRVLVKNPNDFIEELLKTNSNIKT